MIKPTFINRLRHQADIVYIVNELVPLTKAGSSSYKACCPFHDEKSASFTVHPIKQRFTCFGCGARGDLFAFVQEFKRVSFVEAVEYIAGRYHEVVEYDTTPKPTSKFSRLKL